MLLDSTIRSVPMGFQLEAPALYRTMLKPRPGSVCEFTFVDFRVKKASARSSRLPNCFAHHAKDVPQPSQVPQFDGALMTVVTSALASGVTASTKANAARAAEWTIRHSLLWWW